MVQLTGTASRHFNDRGSGRFTIAGNQSCDDEWYSG
jgi:hypothetical protein